MKKLLLILLCFPMIGFGQGFERSLEIGLTLGPSVNSSDHPLMELYSMERVGNKHITFTEFISLRYNYSSFISFSTQVGYKNIRNEYSDDFFYDFISSSLVGDWETVSTQKYIHIPFLLEYNLSQERLKLSLKAGVYTSYLLDNIMTTTLIDESQNIAIEYICDCYNEWDFGATGGIGLSYATSNKYSLIFDFLVNQSLLKTPPSSMIATETSIKEEIEGGKYYNNASYTALLGFSYTLKQ